MESIIGIVLSLLAMTWYISGLINEKDRQDLWDNSEE